MHNNVFNKLNFKACYTRVHLQEGTKLREVFLSLGLSGANVTVPHKEAAFLACDEVRGFAKKIGVVNTIINEDGRLIGYNTDADGFMYAIESFKTIKNVLIIGAGGTAKALAARFLEDGINVTILNRSASKFDYFESMECYTWDTFKPKGYDLVVNTTSAGLRDEELPAPKNLMDAILDNTSFAADAIYGKITPFLGLAKSKNIECKDGADMLLGQGILANELFTAKKLNLSDIKKYMSETFLF
jgi:shikimate dehydrogenase